MHLLFSITSIEMYFMSGICAFVANLNKKYKKWKRYQRGNQKPYIEEEQTTQWPKEKVQKDKQRSTKHTYTTKDRVTRTPLKTGGGLDHVLRKGKIKTDSHETWKCADHMTG
jgi:hypothetical protein